MDLLKYKKQRSYNQNDDNFYEHDKSPHKQKS